MNHSDHSTNKEDIINVLYEALVYIDSGDSVVHCHNTPSTMDFHWTLYNPSLLLSIVFNLSDDKSYYSLKTIILQQHTQSHDHPDDEFGGCDYHDCSDDESNDDSSNIQEITQSHTYTEALYSKRRRGKCSCLEKGIESFAQRYQDVITEGEEYNKKHNYRASRSTKMENDFLLERIFDAHSNYGLFCHSCLVKHLKFSSKRLARLRQVHQDNLPKHKLTGRPSNARITDDVIDEFKKFAVENSSPNGRCPDGYAATHYWHTNFSSKFTPSPKFIECEKWSDERLQSCVQYMFNKDLEWKGLKQVTSVGAFLRLLRLHAKRITIHPATSDACSDCYMLVSEIKSLTMSITKYLKSGNADSAKVAEMEKQRDEVVVELTAHKSLSKVEYGQYNNDSKKCRDLYQLILAMDLAGEDTTMLKDEFDLVLDGDFQESNLLPNFTHWQPGPVHFNRKLSIEHFAIVHHGTHKLHHNDTSLCEDKTCIMMTDERQAGNKNADHVISMYSKYFARLDSWIQNVLIYFDNGPTNKNNAVMQYFHYLVWIGRFKRIRVRFLVAGHTKFAPDRIFSTIARRMNTRNCYSISHLQSFIRETGVQVSYMVGQDFFTWTVILKEFYDTVPNLTSYREFVFQKEETHVLFRVRERISSGKYNIIQGFVKKFPRTLNYEGKSYADLNRMKPLSNEKLADLKQMYTNYLAHEEDAMRFYQSLVDDNHLFGSNDASDSSGTSQPKGKRKRRVSSKSHISNKRQKTLHEYHN